jgi:hypothetical protein
MLKRLGLFLLAFMAVAAVVILLLDALGQAIAWCLQAAAHIQTGAPALLIGLAVATMIGYGYGLYHIVRASYRIRQETRKLQEARAHGRDDLALLLEVDGAKLLTHVLARWHDILRDRTQVRSLAALLLWAAKGRRAPLPPIARNPKGKIDRVHVQQSLQFLEDRLEAASASAAR